MLRQLAIIALTLFPLPGFALISDSRADLNGDAFTNSLNISVMSSCFERNPVTTPTCTIADIDIDGDIDIDDFKFVSARFG